MRKMLPIFLAALCLSALTPASRAQRPGLGGAAGVEVITRTINDCENRTDRFVKALRRALDRSALSGTNREDDLNRSAKELERSMDRVGKSWNREKDVAKTRQHVRSAIADARNIDITMRNRRLGGDAEEQWRAVRIQIELLARAFKLPSVRW
ncbi:MAG: hypothetical protein JNL98_09665 [Bryobacterales bacterium]|nr:hypothetical protein [Bryobacterales bacterium]